MKRLRIRKRHRRAQPDPEKQCDYCLAGNHLECSGEDVFGEPCECAKCDRFVAEAAQDLSERIEPDGSPE